MNRLTQIALAVGVLLLCAAGWFCLRSGNRDAADADLSKKTLRFRRQTAKDGERQAVKVNSARVAEKSAAKPDAFAGWGDDPFAENPSFDFDEEKDAQMSEQLKGLLAELDRACGSFATDRKAIYGAVSRLLAMAERGESVPQFAKLRAIEALKQIGSIGIPEMLGMMADADDIVVKNATSSLMEQLIDFDVTEAQQLEIIRRLVTVEMSPENYESIAFTISSFKNVNKVKAALAICDTGTDGALAALSNNADFIFDEAEAESIQTRADIVQYGKDHPDSGTDFDIEQAK